MRKHSISFKTALSGILVLLTLMPGGGIYAGEINVNPGNCIISLPEKADSVKSFAAQELQMHIELMTGIKIPINDENGKIGSKSFVIYIGQIFPGDKTALEKEEARYVIANNSAYLYGEDEIFQKSANPMQEVLNEKTSRTGTLFAVYRFLENELGVRWIQPGDKGICFDRKKNLNLSEKTFSWKPAIAMRQIRLMAWQWKYLKEDQKDIPEAFKITESEANKRDLAERIWLRRMGMGRHITLSYGHAFTKWWETYGKSHPEYFAMDEKGERKPWGKPDRIKMCVSSDGLCKEIVNQWLKRYKENPEANQIINVCENDSGGYCKCQECMKLDVREEGEEFGKHLTDRYIWFSNKVLGEARKHYKDVRVIMYAYSVYRFPPRKEKIDPGVIIGFVPTIMASHVEIEKYYDDWAKAGAKEIFLRPNDMHVDSGLPLGFEAKMFDNFKIAVAHGIFATDYDSLHCFWDTSGIANYTLAKGHLYPEKPFEYWENEYCSVFGEAKGDILNYYRHWRTVWEKLQERWDKVEDVKSQYGNFRRAISLIVNNCYNEDDFNKTDIILENALKKNLTEEPRRRINELLISNRHSRLTFNCISENSNSPRNNKASLEDINRKLNSTRKLVDFRLKNKDILSVSWPMQFSLERELGDLTGVELVSIFTSDMAPYRQMSLMWSFKADPENKGLKEGWEKTSLNEIEKWDRIRVDRTWENQKGIDGVPDKLKTFLENYDGIGWYASYIKTDEDLKGKEVYLTFGAVDESCWVYVNGKEAGSRIFKNPDDWKMPFNIMIGKELLNNTKNVITLRVEDKSGAGGIWKPVWISISDKKY